MSAEEAKEAVVDKGVKTPSEPARNLDSQSLRASRTVVIAEIGVNHNGSVEMAKRLVIEAREAGADYAKFQTFRADSVATRDSPLAQYQARNATHHSQMDLLKSLELADRDFRELKIFCENLGIGFLTTAHDLESAEFVFSLNLDWVKVPSGDITNYPFLARVAELRQKVLLSTGVSTSAEVEQALLVLEEGGLSRSLVTVLQCTTEYPAPIHEANLRAMVGMGHEFSVAVGYSDHTLGYEAAIAAVALGAHVIEKHLTLSRTGDGPDHAASLQPSEFAEMVLSIRAVESALGDPQKKPSESEIRNRDVVRKSIVATEEIRSGDVFSLENMGVKRPGSGISPMKWNSLIGLKASRHFSIDEMIELP